MAKTSRKKAPRKGTPVTRVAVRPAAPVEPFAEVAAPRVRANPVTVAAAKENKGLWQRLREKVSPPVRDEEMRQQMAAVKAGVMHELETLSAQKGIRLTGQPFRSVVLPQMRRRRRWVWPVVGALVLAVVVVMVMVAQRPADPGLVLHQAFVAVRKGDVDGFARRVDVDAVAASVVNQLFTAPQMNAGALPVEAQQATAKPALATALKNEVMDAVAHEGKPADDEKNLLLGIWQNMGGDSLGVGRVNIAMQDENMAVVEVPLEREDLGLTLPLQVVMRRNLNGSGSDWKIVDMPNFAAVLDSMSRNGAAAVAPAAGPEKQASGKDALRVEDIKKSKSAEGGITVTMRITNAGAKVLQNAELLVTFADAAGQPLKISRVAVQDDLAPGESREQVWKLPIDTSKPVERYVRDLPLEALTVKVVMAK
ncbi:MAG: hypothetical protein GC129_04675 [Proteobacteria bacterium]|nr:hypothetical protein [Pseudomonadota bacterium]